ncbi:MAG: SDR family oxidoreductase [bacterium]|nr:SDR family oxidoreductase [bacterium]
MPTVAITGAASGIGLATRKALEAEGTDVIGVDLHDAEVTGDLSKPDTRMQAVDDIVSACGGTLDGFVAGAGISGTQFPGSRVVGLNYFGAVEMLDGLRPALARAQAPAAVAISSNSVTTMPNIPADLVQACLSGDESTATKLGNENHIYAYGGSKLALARWVRRNAVSDDWIGAGITLNAVAPGRTRTAMDDMMLADENIRPHLEAFPIPLGRCGQADEIGDFIAYLLGPKARFFCGSLLYIDGGSDALMRADQWPVTLEV